MKLSPIESRGRVKGEDFVPFHSPLRSPEAEPLDFPSVKENFSEPLAIARIVMYNQ